jgi:hypothetical protein
MGSPYLEDAQRPLLTRRNLTTNEESAGQSGGWLILTYSVGGVRLLVRFGADMDLI